MSNIDEKIAKLKLAKRLKQEEALKESLEKEKEKVEEKKEEVNLEEVIEGIKAGEVNLKGKTFKFEYKTFLNNNLEFPVPVEYLEEKVNTKINVTLVNDTYGISFTGTYVDKGVEKQSFKQFKQGMEKGFKDTELSLEWIEEGEIGDDAKKVYYASYKTPTSRGYLYNMIFYRKKKDTVLIGNYNCFYKDIEIWEHIIKATVESVKIK